MARRKPKEVEINVDDDRLNKADLPRGKSGGNNSRPTNNKGSKPSGKSRSNGNRSKNSSGRSKPNDKQWHSNPKQLVVDAASFATQYPMGVRTPSGYCGMATSFGKTGDFGTQSLTPAVLVMDFIPTVGMPNESQAPVNQAARLQYSYVRYANSGSPVGNPSHLMKFYIAADSLYMLHQTGVRAYGCISQVNYMNQYLPKTLVEALGFDYDDLIANAAQFRYALNLLAMKLRRITIPNNMDYLKRHLWMVQGVYTDSESPRAQMYAFRPVAFYKYVEAEHETLQYAKVPTKFTVANFTAFANELIDAVLQSESFGVTTADILKAYGGDNLLILPEITDTYQVIPIYSEEVMAIVENSSVINVSMFNWAESFALEDDLNPLGDNWIKVHEPFMSYSSGQFTFTDSLDLCEKLQQAVHNITGDVAPAMQEGTLLNVHTAVNQEDIMTFTTLTNNYKVTVVAECTALSASLKFVFEPIAVRSEMIINARIYASTEKVTINGGTSTLQITSYPWKCVDYITVKAKNGSGTTVGTSVWSQSLEIDDTLTAMRFRSFLDSFDWHPACPAQYIELVFSAKSTPMIIGVLDLSVGDFAYYGDGRDLENVIYLTRADLMRMAEVDLISLFDAPEIAILSAKPYSKS